MHRNHASQHEQADDTEHHENDHRIDSLRRQQVSLSGGRPNGVGPVRRAIEAPGLPPNRDFTVFLLEQAGAPFGAAEYIGDLRANANGRGENEFRLIVQEGFASTLVNGQRVRVDLNRVGMWFADPKDDDFCLGANSPVTPFDGDNEAGVQAFNSATAVALPAP
jgi:hypothetical protein